MLAVVGIGPVREEDLEDQYHREEVDQEVPQVAIELLILG